MPFSLASVRAGRAIDALKERMKGVQACIWCEHFLTRDYFNHMVFPRLPAVAEAAWTPKANKDWLRFAAIAPLSPVFDVTAFSGKA